MIYHLKNQLKIQRSFSVGLFFCFLLMCSIGKTYQSESDFSGQASWIEYKAYMAVEKERHRDVGLSYLISGSIATVGGLIAYEAASDSLSRVLYAVTANVGIAAIGLGATYYWTSSEEEIFYDTLEGSSLNLQQKNELLARYLQKQRQQRDSRRWIQVATHALIAAANFYSAAQEENADVRSIFYFLGGANTALAISYSF